jgi:uncharacterized protein (DUF427 family)
MQAIWKGRVLATSTDTREAQGYRYFPRDHVRMELLAASPRTASDKQCPNGVQFYDVIDGEQRSERAAWSYEAPTTDAIRPVDHWMAFWNDVELVE